MASISTGKHEAAKRLETTMLLEERPKFNNITEFPCEPSPGRGFFGSPDGKRFFVTSGRDALEDPEGVGEGGRIMDT